MSPLFSLSTAALFDALERRVVNVEIDTRLALALNIQLDAVQPTLTAMLINTKTVFTLHYYITPFHYTTLDRIMQPFMVI